MPHARAPFPPTRRDGERRRAAPVRVAVVGGGVIGLCVAHSLRARGADVTVIERDRVGHGCSLGNGGWVCPSISTPLPGPGLTLASLRALTRSDSPLYIRPSALPRLAGWLWAFRRHCDAAHYATGVAALAALNADTATRYDELAAAGVAFEMRRNGLLLAFRDPRRCDAELDALSALAPYGVGPVERLDGRGLAESEPGLAGGLEAGLVVHSDRHVRPETLTAGLAAHLRAGGAEIVEGFEVRWLVSEGRRVRAAAGPGGDLEADVFVLATGAECGRLARQVGVRLSVTAGKGYSITVARPPVGMGRPAYLPEAKMGFTPFEGALRVLGTLELSGINRRLDPRRLANLERGARRYLPGLLDGGARQDWVGMRPVTPDGLPHIGRLPTRDNVYAATGHQMLGVTLAPATGHALAQAILEGRSDTDLCPFDPARG